MENPLFVPRDPRVYVVPPGAGHERRVFVTDQGRWYERHRDNHGHSLYGHVADTDEGFNQAMEEQHEPAAVELDEDDPLAEVVLAEFAALGKLYPEVPVIADQDVAA